MNLQNTREAQEQDDGDDANDDVSDLLQLPIHGNVIEDQSNDEKNDEG